MLAYHAFQPRPQGAFPWFFRPQSPKPGKSVLKRSLLHSYVMLQRYFSALGVFLHNCAPELMSAYNIAHSNFLSLCDTAVVRFSISLLMAR